MKDNLNWQDKEDFSPIIHLLIKKLPNIWIGYILAAILFMFEIVSFSVSPENSLLFFILTIPIVFYLLWCIARFHSVLRIATFNRYPIGPAKAVGYHIIPLFNIYWVFRWPYEIANFLNKKQETKIMVNWLGIFLILGFILYRFLDVATGIVVYFSVFFYIHRKLQNFFSMPYYFQSLIHKGESDSLSIKAIKAKIKPLSKESGERNAILTITLILFFVYLIAFERNFQIICKFFPPKEGYLLTLKININDTLKRNEVEDYTKKILYKRAKELGVRCVTFVSNKKGEIIAKLPGIKDAQKVRGISMPGYLEFKLVDESMNPRDALSGNPPPGSEILYQEIEDPKTGKVTGLF